MNPIPRVGFCKNR